MDLIETLKTRFQLEGFRYPQEEIITTILNRQDALVIMPTGGGKSLCFQLPAVLLPGVTLVVSPLIALMKDQVDALKRKGVAAEMINSTKSWPQQLEILRSLKSGSIKLLYISPERFRAQSFVRALGAVSISLLAVDEAHCISQWGHDFRPDYLRLGEARKLLGNPLCAAFTATATPEVKEDIQRNLRMANPQVFVSGFARPNLTFLIRKPKTRKEKFDCLLRLIEKHRTGIVYCATRKSVEEVSAHFSEKKADHIVYHGGLTDLEREESQNRFINREISVAVATNAFGMGIDRADIRFVCHYEMPGSIEAYYQEAGRAGRDGGASVCELLFMYSDKRVQDFFLEGGNPDSTLIKSVYHFLQKSANADQEVFLSTDSIVEGMEGNPNPMAVGAALGVLRRMRVIERFDIPGKRLRGTRLLQPALKSQELRLDDAALAEKKRRDESKLKKVVEWAFAQTCREQWILRYFGETQSRPCGRCDTCRPGKNERLRELTADEWIILQKALSGVARMSFRSGKHEWKARFGRDRIIKCLLGSKAQSIVQSGLDRLPTWGVLKDQSMEFMNRLFDVLLQRGLLETTDGDYPLIQLTELGSRVMFREETIQVAWPQVGKRQKEEGKRQKEEGGGEYDADLFNKLKDTRNELRVLQGNAPAYTILSNKTLMELARLKPTSIDAALKINGIGPTKVKTVVPAFLEVIRGHSRK